jgi:6-pyruvoyl-tetrahydropterin synthase
MVTIQTEKSIAIAHLVQTADKESPCRRLHGHNLKIIVEINGTIKKDGMVVDFRHIKSIINSLDHLTLLPRDIVTLYEDDYVIKTKYTTFSLPINMCYILPIPVVTAEYLAAFLWDKIYELLDSGWLVITIYESDKSFASVSNRDSETIRLRQQNE